MTTNKTTYYDLPQWIPTDEVSILDDFNGAFADIDTGIHEAKAVADSANTAASNAASNASTALGIGNDNQSDITALQSAQTTQGNAVNTLTGVVNGHTTTIGGINTKLGTADISSIGDGTVTGALEALSEGSSDGGTILWQNPSPNSGMDATTLPLSKSINNFSYYEILYKSASDKTYIHTTGKLPTTFNTTLYHLEQKPTIRWITLSGVNIGVSGGAKYTSFEASIADATACIPVKIIGYN